MSSHQLAHITTAGGSCKQETQNHPSQKLQKVFGQAEHNVMAAPRRAMLLAMHAEAEKKLCTGLQADSSQARPVIYSGVMATSLELLEGLRLKPAPAKYLHAEISTSEIRNSC